jgi:hypothetical protein
LLPSFSQNDQGAIPFMLIETAHLNNIRDCAISPDGDEIYFTHQKPDFSYSVIYQLLKLNGTWGKPKMMSFFKKSLDMEPAFSPDGLRLYFVSDHAHGNGEKNFDIWYLERKNETDEWSEPVHPKASFNSDANEFYPSICSNGDVYFTSDRIGTKGKDDIFCSRFDKGAYQEAFSLSDSINTTDTEYNAFVSPDGSFLIFGAYKRADGYGSGDLYISFKQKDETWSFAQNLGPKVNSTRMDYCPFVDLKNKIFYFTSKRDLENSRDDLKESNNPKKYPGGQSRLFSLPLSAIEEFGI